MRNNIVIFKSRDNLNHILLVIDLSDADNFSYPTVSGSKTIEK